MEIEWGGSGIEEVVFGFILGKIDPQDIVVEFGSGFVSTQALSKCCKLWSIDHNKNYQNKYPNVKYIHAPLVDEWYDLNILKAKLPIPKLVFVDGVNRLKLADNIKLFSKETMYVVHDTYRDEEQKLVKAIAKHVDRKPSWYETGDYWAFI